MHDHAANFIVTKIIALRLQEADVLDLGGKTVWGLTYYSAVFDHKPTVVDLQPGSDVDIVADAADWDPDHEYDLVLVTEVFEHTPRWRDIIATSLKATKPGGYMICTCARDDRPPHSAIDGANLRPGEFYCNLTAADLYACLEAGGWREWEVYEADGVFGNDDLYAWAQR